MKLKASSIQELHFLSGLIQGSIWQIKNCNISNGLLQISNINRFQWEEVSYCRIKSTIAIDNIKCYTIPPIDKNKYLVILAIVAIDYEHIRLYCADLTMVDIYLKDSTIVCYLEDYGESWPTTNPPHIEDKKI